MANAETHKPKPNWSMGTTDTRSGVSARSTDGEVSTLAAWGCHGHANQPYTAYENGTGKKGVVYSAFQDCTGDFELQKVCVQLWALDYYGAGSAVSTMSCGRQTVAAHAFRGLFLTCSAIGRGNVRFYTKSKTYAYPDGVSHSSGGQSAAVYLC